ncbi:MAG: DNA-binding response regulator [Planctomycetota bacterium]|nr:MAG: DNA-binding response regulator [Planctomycetota bacterium]
MTIRLLIADDHEVVRSGLKTLLAGADIEVVAEAATGGEALRLVAERNPDVVLLDIRMPDGDGLSALQQLKQDHPKLPVLMLSTYDNPTYVSRAVSLGASGYVLKGSGREKLIQAIQSVAEGEATWTREEMRRMTGAMAAPRAAGDLEAALTQRENEVLTLLAHGLTNKQIAERLGISYETVKEHVQHVLRKIGVADRTQAAVWAVRSGLA